MTIVIKFICPICKVHHHKNRNCTGDWHNTEWGVVLQSYCPVCGRMEPLIEGERMSNNHMKRCSVRIAREFDLSFSECKRLAKGSDGVDFVHLFSTEFNLRPEQITSAMNNGSDKKEISHPRA